MDRLAHLLIITIPCILVQVLIVLAAFFIHWALGVFALLPCTLAAFGCYGDYLNVRSSPASHP